MYCRYLRLIFVLRVTRNIIKSEKKAKILIEQISTKIARIDTTISIYNTDNLTPVIKTDTYIAVPHR